MRTVIIIEEKAISLLLKRSSALFSLIHCGLLGISSPIVNSISSFKRFISAEYRYLFRDTVCTLNLYYYSAAVKLIIDRSIFFAAFIISFWAFRSISPVAPSFRSPKIASNGVNHSLISLIYSGRPIFLLARFIASNKSDSTTDFFPVSRRVNKILLFTGSSPLLGASSWGRFFCFLTTVIQAWVAWTNWLSFSRLFSLAISVN